MSYNFWHQIFAVPHCQSKAWLYFVIVLAQLKKLSSACSSTLFYHVQQDLHVLAGGGILPHANWGGCQLQAPTVRIAGKIVQGCHQVTMMVMLDHAFMQHIDWHSSC